MNENTKRYIIIGVIAVFVLAFAYCISGGKGVQCNGDTADGVGNKIGQAADKQRDISQRLERAESTAGDITDSIGRSAGAVSAAQDTANSIEAAIEEQRVLIGECQQIIAGIRRAGEADTDKD